MNVKFVTLLKQNTEILNWHLNLPQKFKIKENILSWIFIWWITNNFYNVSTYIQNLLL